MSWAFFAVGAACWLLWACWPMQVSSSAHKHASHERYGRAEDRWCLISCSRDQWPGRHPLNALLMRGVGIKRDHLHGSTGGIDNLKPPSLPLIGMERILSAKLHGRKHGCLNTGRLNALLIADHDLAVREIEVVACEP